MGKKSLSFIASGLRAFLLSGFSLLIFFSLFLSSSRKDSGGLTHEVVLASGWRLISSQEIKLGGKEISGAGLDLVEGYSAEVPATVLAVLVKNGPYKYPYFGKNLENIPRDMFRHAWWYCKEFVIERRESFEAAHLVFEGINYRANIWLNGNQIASSDTVFGSFRIFEFDITPLINDGKNILAVEVFPPQPGDFTIGFVDWNPRPPDENMGLWREVKLRLTGAVSVNDVFVRSKVNLDTLAEAFLTVTADLINHTDQKAAGVVKGKIEDREFSQDYELGPQERKRIIFDSGRYEALHVKNPRLWWPNNLGEPNLYSLHLEAIVNKKVSDEKTIRFGIREVSDFINEKGFRGYMVNGKKVLIRGGGWADDLMLVSDEKKIRAQIKYAKHMNLNAIRLEGFWGSSQKLYDLADEHGILVMPGWSCQWEWANYLGGPTDSFGGVITAEDMDLISRSLNDQVIWLRNHPSIFVWVLGSDVLPRPALEKKYRAYLAEADPTRPYLAACSSRKSEISGPTAVKMNGPYDYVTPNYWYLDKKNGGAFGFNTETGPGPQPPPLESIKKMIPEGNLWPVDDVWNYHCARGEFNTLSRYLEALDRRYGKPENLEDFSLKAQAANYEAIRGMFEAFGVNKFNSTGIIQWMLNAAWPKMYWQLYDYYLMPTGAFYGTRKACQPVNIVYNYSDKDIYVVNDTLSEVRGVKAEIRVFDVHSMLIFSEDVEVSVGENMSEKILDMPDWKEKSPVYFLDLRIRDARGKVFSSNFYWLSDKEDVLDERKTTWYVTPNKEYADFTALEKLTEVEIKERHEFLDLDSEQEVVVTLENPTESIAFFIELALYGEKSGSSVLPVFWEDNYVSLLPGESREIRAHFSKKDLKGDQPALRLTGWNIRSR